MTRHILPLVAVLSLLVIAAVFVFRPLPTLITPENVDRVKVGMTLAAVTAILGEPRDETGTGPRPLINLSSSLRPPNERRQWVGESWMIVVETDPSGKVLMAGVSPHTFESPWQYVQWRTRRVLGLAPDEPTLFEAEDDMVYTLETVK